MKRSVWFVFIIILFIAVFFSYQHGKRKGNDKPYVDSITYVDTVSFLVPVPVDSVVIRYKTVTLPVKDSSSIKLNSAGNNVNAQDSVNVVIPIIQKEYKDSTYHAWVSGYEPAIDSIYVYPKHTIITKNIPSRMKRWGLGIQTGIGMYGDKISPFVGIGISYNIFTW